MAGEDPLKPVKDAFAAGDYGRAERLARVALGAIGDPGSDDALWLRTAVARGLAATGRPDEAGALLRPEMAAADTDTRRILVASALDRCGFPADALVLCQRILDGGARNQEVLRLAGDTLVRLGRPAEAEPLIREALDRGAGRSEAEARLMPLLAPGGEAAACNILDRFLERSTTQLRTRIALTMALLAQGRWVEAWPYYEGRAVTSMTRAELPYPYWRGDLAPNRLLVFRAEQGVGDLIMFARFAVLLGGLGVPVMLMVEPRLRSLCSTLPGIAGILAPNQRVQGGDAVWAPLASLLAFFRLMPETVPPMRPYLSADPERVERWRATLPADGLRVGIAWQGSPHNPADVGRSIPLAAFAPLADIPGSRLVALQKGFGAEQIETCGFGERILVPGPDFDAGDDAFLDTAAMMMSLDLVITSDTSIAHMAGALGRPCFLALRKYPEWRWGTVGETTAWYPSMRLFRQSRDGDWDEVFERIAGVLRARGNGE